MIRVALLVSHYLPGYRAGGPIRSIANLVQALGDEFQFTIITSDRDLGSDRPYRNVVSDKWLQSGKAQVMYLSPRSRMPDAMRQLLGHAEYDVLYLNSFFSRSFSILPLWLKNLGLIRSVPTLLAPRGEFAASALGIKPLRKRLYIRVAFGLGLYRQVIWHASSEFERRDILRVLPSNYDQRNLILAGSLLTGIYGSTCEAWLTANFITVASDLPISPAQPTPRLRSKKPAELRLVFLARIARMKNLVGALRALGDLRGNVTFDIYGPLEDAAYWRECQEVIAQLPANVQVRQLGEVDHAAVPSILGQYDLFILPTLGENFGHAIAEALAAGCPVLISDRTPWRNLEAARAGFDVPLEQPERFHEILQFFIDMDEPTHGEWHAGAQAYIKNSPWLADAVEQNRRLFLSAVEQGRKAYARRTAV